MTLRQILTLNLFYKLELWVGIRYNGNMDNKPMVKWEAYGKITIFIDAANVIYSLKDLGWQIDYKKLQKYFLQKAQLNNIYYYSAYFDNDIGRKNLHEMLSRKGFIVRTKLVKEIKKTDGGLLHKANCDVELTMDIMSEYKKIDTLVLLSGDSDFVPLINKLKSEKKKTIVISTRGHIARELIESADVYLHFNQFKKFWVKPDKIKKRPKRRSR